MERGLDQNTGGPIKLKWIKSKLDTWLPFETLNLKPIDHFGVYVIWHAGRPSQTVKVGRGKIGPCLRADRENATIVQYRSSGALYVTWAVVDLALAGGVERYLVEYLKPLAAEGFPDTSPIAVNSPF